MIKSEVADPLGNLTFNKTGRNFSPLMCMAATGSGKLSRQAGERQLHSLSLL